MKNYESPEILNVGTGEDLTIRELAEMMARVTGFRGALVFDHSKPDGTPRKVLDVSRIHALGWEARIPLEEGIAATYKWYLTHQQQTVSP
jgi:GDP-L-fucose synthase